MRTNKFFNWIALIAILVAGLIAATPTQAQGNTPVDLGVYTADDTHPWPATSPYPNAKAVEMVFCQFSVGQYDPEGKTRWYDVSANGYAQMTTACKTGVAWFKDSAPSGTKFENQTTTDGSMTMVTPTPMATVAGSANTSSVQLGVCVKETTREGRLDCATALYFSHGEKLSGIMAYMKSLGASWDEIAIGDPFQPDATPLNSGSPRIWGALLKATNLKVTGNSCLVTDVPSRIGNFKWAFIDDRYAPRPSVWHAGEAATAGTLVEIAFHADCLDWVEIATAKSQGGIYRPYQSGSGQATVVPQPTTRPTSRSTQVVATRVPTATSEQAPAAGQVQLPSFGQIAQIPLWICGALLLIGLVVLGVVVLWRRSQSGNGGGGLHPPTPTPVATAAAQPAPAPVATEAPAQAEAPAAVEQPQAAPAPSEPEPVPAEPAATPATPATPPVGTPPSTPPAPEPAPAAPSTPPAAPTVRSASRQPTRRHRQA